MSVFDFVSVEGMACRRRWVRCVQRFAGIFCFCHAVSRKGGQGLLELGTRDCENRKPHFLKYARLFFDGDEVGDVVEIWW